MMGYSPISPIANFHEVQHGSLQDVQLHQLGSSTGLPSDSEPKSSDKANFESDQPLVKGWPIQSQHVATITPLRAFIIFFDTILASTPIVFIALALIAGRLDGNDVSEYGVHLKQALLLSPTIFPIIFAALMSRCFKHIGLYRAERGITLGRLEQLVGCQSLFSALERQIALRSWSILGLIMTFVWLLSPLGGQSALRLLDQQPLNVSTTQTFHYLNPGAVLDSLMDGASDANSGRSTYLSIFLAALLSSSNYRKTPMDLWGNVKIPLYRSVANESSSNAWKPVNITPDTTYASLIGIPVATNTTGASNFTIKARHFDITCDSNQEKNEKDADFGAKSSTWKWNTTDGTTQGKPCNDWPCAIVVKSIDSSENYTVAQCNLDFQYVEAKVQCQGRTCDVNSLRKLDLYTDGITHDNAGSIRTVMMFNQMGQLVTIDNYGVGSISARGSTNAEKWIANPENFIGATFKNVDLWRLPPAVLADRLTIIWNTFFQSTYATTAIAGNLPANLSSLSTDPFYVFNATTADVSTFHTIVYKTNWRWFVALLVAAIILQIAAYAGLILKYITLAPDIIGYASSLTLMNPYIPTPTGGTTLHGLERAALLHDLPIRIGDVCSDEEIGAIAVAKADNGRVGRLSRQRYYI